MANYIKGTAIQENSISETKLDSSLQSWKETVTNHINNNDNPHNITKSSIGLDNVTNDAQVKRSELGVANGVATLDSTGKVPSGQLPSYVDDVIEGYLYNGVFYKDTSYTTSIVGESGKIYIDLPTNKTYRWTGSVYGVISETIALGEISSTAYRGDRGKIAYDHSQSAHAPSNAQANVIETIKVNGTALTPNSKAVDITIPTVGNGTITIKQGGTSKGTFTTNQNGNTTIELTDTNTTYTAGDGLSLSGTTFSNNGVRSIATGTTNGTISVNTNGNISNIGVYGLKSAAYTNSSDYAAASHTHSQYLTGITKAMVEGVLTGNITSHTHSYLPLAGGTMSNTNVVTNLNADLLDGYHQGHAIHYLWTGTYTQPTSGAIWYLKIKTTDWRDTPDWIWVKCSGNNAHDEYVINTGSRSTAWWAYGVQYNTQLINGCTKIISASCDTYIRLTANCTSVTLYATFTPASVTYDSASSYTSIVPGLNASTFYGNATSSSKWANARTITLTGSVTGSVSIDGSQNVSLATTTNHTHNYLPLSGGTLTGSITMQGMNTNLIRNITYTSTSSWARGLINLQVDGISKFSISALGDYTLGASDNGINYAYIGCNSYDGLNLRISATSLSWGDNSILHSGNYNSYALPLSGGTVTGALTINTYIDSSFILDEPTGEKYHKISFRASGKEYAYLLSDNHGSENKLVFNGSTILHSGNFNTYSPKLDGTGASGTWGINISGNADTIDGYHASQVLTTNYSDTVDLNEISVPSIYRLSAQNPNLPSSIFSYGNLLTVKYHTADTAWQLIGSHSSDNLWFRRGTWYADGKGTLRTNAWKVIAFTDSNVASATKLQNSRTLWGQSFDGTGNVSGSLTGKNFLLMDRAPNPYLRLTDSYGNVYFQIVNGDAYIGSTSSKSLMVDGEGNVGIGTTSPACKLDVEGDIRASKTLSSSSIELNGALPYIDFHYDGATDDYTSRIIEDASGQLTVIGKLRIGSDSTTSNNYTFYVASGDSFFYDNVITGSDFSSRGDAIIDGTVSCTKLLQTSDIKYKTNIKQIKYEEALKIIENLNPVTWDWNENTIVTGSSSGFVAQEAEEFIPNAISRDNENNLSLDYTQLHSYEIRVIQEQQKEIKDLKQRLEVLENLVLQLTNKEI